MQFSPETIRKAKEELRENEDKKKHSLQQFKEWIKVHPFIKKCCTDDVFLLAFLRVKKYWNDEAFKVFENYLLFRYKNKKWFDLSDEKLERYRELTRSGYLYNSVGRNYNKSSYMMCNMSKVDLNKFGVDELFHCYFTNTILMLIDEKTQVNGLGGAANLKNVTMRQVAIYPVGQVINFTKYLTNANPLRFVSIEIIGAPSFANQILNIFKMALPEKLRQRVHAIGNYEELQQAVSKECIPKEMGGEVPEEELIERHLKNFEKNLPMLRKIADFELILENIDEEIRAENVGSFRKLTID
ncbi:hypothetical protein PVAND_013761 [Polypedilum vanderplanki]|uniref:CRAL-TRIO domain-containing protein n=1 Tax=Polypedilum vanderplanki TaxID=319348 RepID=A0A9J6CR85_POLVA|nr:hypothetical protein PVAND_013761 [Polypedilum vanderplanki]